MLRVVSFLLIDFALLSNCAGHNPEATEPLSSAVSVDDDCSQ